MHGSPAFHFLFFLRQFNQDGLSNGQEVGLAIVCHFKGVHPDPPARLVTQVGFGPPWWSLVGNNGAIGC